MRLLKKKTKSKAVKFEKVEEKIPDLFVVAQRLQDENDSIKNDNINLIMYVERLFESEKKFDFNSRLVVYKELIQSTYFKILILFRNNPFKFNKSTLFQKNFFRFCNVLLKISY